MENVLTRSKYKSTGFWFHYMDFLNTKKKKQILNKLI